MGGEMTTTKDRILEASTELFRRQGFANTGLKQIASQADAAFGSIYHFFPGGKDGLGEAVIRAAGRTYLGLIESSFGEIADLPATIRAFFGGAADLLTATDFKDACPIAGIALEVASTNEPLRGATAEVFAEWIDATAERITKTGLSRPQSEDLAAMMFCALEGAFILCRATRDTRPLRLAGEMAAQQAAAMIVGR
jgi:AcrR family transcriptional regulator